MPLRRHALDPLRIELVAAVVAQEDLAIGAAALGETQEPTLERVEAPVAEQETVGGLVHQYGQAQLARAAKAAAGTKKTAAPKKTVVKKASPAKTASKKAPASKTKKAPAKKPAAKKS